MEKNLLKKIDKHILNYYKIDTSNEYNIEYVKAKDLLVPERIDLIAKYKYIEAYENKYETSFYKDLYKKTIEAFSEGKFSEPGKEEKNSFEKYINEFNKLIENIKTKGLDENISVVPVGANNAILDGAHRVSIAAYFDLEVPIIRFKDAIVDYGPNFFKKRLLDEESIKYLILEYCKLKNNIYCVCLWPSCSKKNVADALDLLQNNVKILYRFDINLSYNGIKNFMTQIYKKFDWIGTYKDGHKGVLDKVDKCFLKDNKTRIIIIESLNSETVIETKKTIRKMIGIDNHSIHSTDDIIETIEMLELVLTESSIHFLNNGDPDKYPEFNKKLLEFNDEIVRQKIDFKDIVIDSSSVMALYGIRENNDIDFLVNKKYLDKIINDKINPHNSELVYYDTCLDDLLYNPKNYFMYNGFKFVNLNQLLIMKKNRNEMKDKDDVILINHKMRFNSKFSYKILIINFKRKLRFIKNKTKDFIKKILIKLGLFDKIKKLRKGNN